jgi:4a-hydroxytetrahydrobiopterin dehydratase
MPVLTDDQIASALASLPGWARDGNTIRKTFAFAGFPQAVDFVARLVPGAEAADHHPDLAINYRRVTVSYTTHSAGGLTEKDVAGARVADEQAGRV